MNEERMEGKKFGSSNPSQGMPWFKVQVDFSLANLITKICHFK